MEISGSRALVTGATGGIGEAIARRLHARGATVVLSGRREDVLERLAAELGDRAEVVVADLADADQVTDLPERCGRVDVLVANAALPASGDLASFEPGQVDRALDVNLRAPVQLTHALLPGMRERGSGHLVFISSIAGKVASPGGSLYSATKFGLRGFALGLHNDLAGSGVGVTTVFPGFVRDAGMFHESGAEIPSYVRTSSPAQVAKAVSKGIERGKVEIDVAPLEVRLTGVLSSLAPRLVGAAQRRLGGADVSAEIARGQADKR